MNSREKGKRGERELAARLRELGYEARRGVQFAGSPDSPDVVSSVPGVHWEVKRRERFDLYGSMEQAITECGGSVPVVAHRKNGKGWVVVLRLEDFLAGWRN